MVANGLLLVMMQPSPVFEEEFNAWYDTDHIPERLAVPGFLSAQRYICLSGAPRYLAVYDLANVEILDTPAYCAVAGENYTPWTRRVLSRVRSERVVGRSCDSDARVTSTAARLSVLRFRALDAAARGDVQAGLTATYGKRRELAQMRLFACGGGAHTDYLALVETRTPVEHERIDIAGFERAAGSLDLVNIYARY